MNFEDGRLRNKSFSYSGLPSKLPECWGSRFKGAAIDRQGGMQTLGRERVMLRTQRHKGVWGFSRAGEWPELGKWGTR